MHSGSSLRLTVAGERWILEGDSYALMRALNAIPMAKRLANGNVSLPMTPETASELMWFRSRFPFKAKNEAKLRTDSAKDKLRRVRLAEVDRAPRATPIARLREGRTAREYQSYAARLFRAGGSLLLADDLGLGKTVSAIASFCDPAYLPAVVVCPANLTLQWAEKIKEFSHLTTHILKVTTPYSLRVITTCGECGETPLPTARIVSRCSYCGAKRFVSDMPDVLITSYHKLDGWSGVLPKLAKTVVFDEIQELRRTTSKKYVAAHALAHAASHRLGLSATPIHNYGGEMYNVLDCLFPTRLGSKADFKNVWCSGFEREGSEPKLKDPEAFGRFLTTERMMLRRTRAEVGRELPEHQEIVVPLNASLDAETNRKAKEFARAMLKQTVSSNRHAQFEAQTGLDSLIRKATGIAKAKETANFVEMLLESGEAVVLFGWHTSVYEIWARELARFKPAFYTGEQGLGQKAAAKAEFVDGRTKLLIVSLRSAAGLDGLQQRCNVGVFGELDWSPAVMDQCKGRYHRDGQTERSLTYIMLNSEGSDPYIADVLGVKTRQLSGVILDQRPSSVLRQTDAQAALRKMAEAYLQA